MITDYTKRKSGVERCPKCDRNGRRENFVNRRGLFSVFTHVKEGNAVRDSCEVLIAGGRNAQ